MVPQARRLGRRWPVIKTLACALLLTLGGMAYASPAKHDSHSVTVAKAEVATAKAHLKAAKSADRAGRAMAKKAKHARAKAAAMRIMAEVDCAHDADNAQCDDYQRTGDE